MSSKFTLLNLKTKHDYPIGGTVQKCVFTGSNLTYTNMSTVDLGGCLIRTSVMLIMI